MDKRGAATETLLREYAAAEERLLDFFSPLSVPEEAGTQASAAAAPFAAPVFVDTTCSVNADQNAIEVDPSRDNMLPFISDDAELHSLVSNCSDFKGFENNLSNAGDTADSQDPNCIYGIYRPSQHVEEAEHSSSPVAVLEVTSDGEYILANGIASEPMAEEQMGMGDQHVIEESHGDCILYDDNMMLLADDQCCEIIVTEQGMHTDHEIDHAYLMGMHTVVPDEQQQQQNNNAGYSINLLADEQDEENVEPTDNEQQNYPRDAALEQQQQEEHEQSLIEVDGEEIPNGSYDDDKPDICQVYPHELEDHDDDCAVNAVVESQENSQLQLQAVELEEPEQSPILIASDAEEQQQPEQAVVGVVHSSTTEFPVSSTSMPDGSDYDDYDDDLDTARDRLPPQRKYVKNTLSADAMDRRLASMSQSQAQMSVSEKLANWNCAQQCDPLEDVDNFEAEFEQHEADEAVQVKFFDFYKKLRGDSLDKEQISAAPANVFDGAGKRLHSRRFLHVVPDDAVEPIVLDDDEDDDDCIEVQETPSQQTLVAEAIVETSPPELVLKTIETQTVVQSTQSKETSTIDLDNNICMPPPPPVPRESHEFIDISQLHREKQDASEQPIYSVSTGQEHQPDGQFNEQHEFCNYLGLTELATANAVATAMRELANSTVARRSLRVRSQQQLDRMRSDVLGRRREMKHQKQKWDNHQEEDTNSSISQQSYRTNSRFSNTPDPADIHVETDVQTTSLTNKETTPKFKEIGEDAIDHMKNFYQSPGTGADEQHGNQPQSAYSPLQEAFSQVYAAAAPAQNVLHESIQNRLRLARETKPSIYIVKALNNSPATSSATGIGTLPSANERLKYNQTMDQVPVMETDPETELEPDHQSKPEPILISKLECSQPAAKSPRKLPKKTPQKSSKLGASTSAAAVPSDRELITRSMNSKMLRNRKVNMLKTYELSDVLAQNRKQRASTGSIAVPKRPKKTASPKKATSPKNASQQQCQYNEQTVRLTIPPPLEAPPKRLSAQQEKWQHHQPPKRKRLRAKSLPQNDVRLAISPVEMELKLTKPMLDTEDSTMRQAVTSSPLYSATVRRYVTLARNQKRQQQLEDVGGNKYDVSMKLAFIYPPISPPSSQSALHCSRRERRVGGFQLDQESDQMRRIHMTPPGQLILLTNGSTALSNPLAGHNGKVLYIYYELDQLIVVQEQLVSFWKYSKIFNVLQRGHPEEAAPSQQSQPHAFNAFAATANGRTVEAEDPEDALDHRWVHLGGIRRITNDVEVIMPFDNRLCFNNSTPVYIEMRSHLLDHHRRESKLLSLYVNVYYYCDEEMCPKMHSVHLDAVNCGYNQVIYTCIADSRYFVMAWQQEVAMGRPRAGICKYSLTPTLDTLASIREFKQLRHELKHIECLAEDRLIGYGQTRLTIWDHRSGDTLMNYDFGFNIGRSLGAMHFPSFDMDQSSLLVLYQHVKEQANSWSELRVIACELSHSTPSHRILQVHCLPSPQFDEDVIAVNTGDHLILKSARNDEIWMSTMDPQQLMYMAPQNTQRFYARQRSQVIVMTPETLAVDSITNHVLKLATQHQQPPGIFATTNG